MPRLEPVAGAFQTGPPSPTTGSQQSLTRQQPSRLVWHKSRPRPPASYGNLTFPIPQSGQEPRRLWKRHGAQLYRGGPHPMGNIRPSTNPHRQLVHPSRKRIAPARPRTRSRPVRRSHSLVRRIHGRSKHGAAPFPKTPRAGPSVTRAPTLQVTELAVGFGTEKPDWWAPSPAESGTRPDTPHQVGPRRSGPLPRSSAARDGSICRVIPARATAPHPLNRHRTNHPPLQLSRRSLCPQSTW